MPARVVRADAADGPDPLRQARRSHDCPHRQGRALSLLRLFIKARPPARAWRSRWRSWTIWSPSATEADRRLRRLYDAIEAGVADLDDPALEDRLDGLKAVRDQASADADRAPSAA